MRSKRQTNEYEKGGPFLSHHSSLITHHFLTFVLHRLASLLKHLAIPNKSRARIGRQLKVLCQLETRGRTSFLTESTEHATRRVENEFVQYFLTSRFAGYHDLDVHRQHVYAIFGAGQRTEVAGDAERVMSFGIHVQTRRPVKTRRNVGTNFRILFR